MLVPEVNDRNVLPTELLPAYQAFPSTKWELSEGKRINRVMVLGFVGIFLR
jgi:hypothetical protein